jgi:hypothetical protein
LRTIWRAKYYSLPVVLLRRGVLREPHIVNVACLKAYVDASEEK